MHVIVVYFLIAVLPLSSSVDHGSVLCRSCGCNILKSNNIIWKESPASLYSFNDTIFDTESILVQVLKRDIIFQFPVITANHSNCIGFGEWEEEELWFPGYHWKPCLCAECGVLVGWIFKKYNLGLTQTHLINQFFALILPNLLCEKSLESLIAYPV